MRRAALAVLVGALVGVVLAAAADAGTSTDPPTMTALRHQLARERVQVDRLTDRLRRELRRTRARVDRLRRAVRAGGIAAANAHLAAIAACESGGRPGAISPGGTYRGKYQFDLPTWRSVGGTGDPAAAPEIEQDWRAWLLYQRRGAQPWPVCGS